MPQTIIKVKTFMCPLGIGNVNGECRFHKAFNEIPQDGLCPIHKLPLEKTTDPLDKITMTVMGEEKIEQEIAEVKDKKQKGEKLPKNAPDFSTPAKEEEYRIKRRQDIVQAIAKARELEDN